MVVVMVAVVKGGGGGGSGPAAMLAVLYFLVLKGAWMIVLLAEERLRMRWSPVRHKIGTTGCVNNLLVQHLLMPIVPLVIDSSSFEAWLSCCRAPHRFLPSPGSASATATETDIAPAMPLASPPWCLDSRPGIYVGIQR